MHAAPSDGPPDRVLNPRDGIVMVDALLDEERVALVELWAPSRVRRQRGRLWIFADAPVLQDDPELGRRASQIEGDVGSRTLAQPTPKLVHG
jgi:hypothetical protein